MRHQIKWIWENMDAKLHKRHILALVLSVTTSLMILINPALTQRLVDEVIMVQNAEPLLGILALMLSTKLIREALRYYMIVTLEKDAQNVVYNLRSRLFTRMQYNDIRFFSCFLNILHHQLLIQQQAGNHGGKAQNQRHNDQLTHTALCLFPVPCAQKLAGDHTAAGSQSRKEHQDHRVDHIHQ